MRVVLADQIPDEQKGVLPAQTHPHFDAFVQTIARLRAPGGCPWDIKQTHASAKKHIIEEAYECVEAIEQGDMDHLREELGDLLEQVVLQSQIAADYGAFTIDDVCRDVNEKIIRRHPHVFGEGDEQVSSPEEVLDLWNKVKQEERAAQAAKQQRVVHAFDSIPRSLPALMETQKMSAHMAKCEKRYSTISQVWNDIYEEIYEYKTESKGSASAAMEFGDLLFTLVNAAQFDGIDAEMALRMANEKVRRRWAHVEDTIAQRELDVAQLTEDDWEVLWNQVKQQQRETCVPGVQEKQQVVHELDSISRELPALMGAQNISIRMAERGFEYHNIDQIWNDVYEEIDEYKAEPANSSHAVMEFGDLLFTLVNVARFDSIDAEEALRMASEKVRRRWAYMEDTIAQRGLDVAQLTDDEWETLWTQAKAKEESNE